MKSSGVLIHSVLDYGSYNPVSEVVSFSTIGKPLINFFMSQSANFKF
jgi:hypothetical protein